MVYLSLHVAFPSLPELGVHLHECMPEDVSACMRMFDAVGQNGSYDCNALVPYGPTETSLQPGNAIRRLDACVFACVHDQNKSLSCVSKFRSNFFFTTRRSA